MSIAGNRVLIIVEGLLISERCHRAGRSKHGRYFSIGGGAGGGFCWYLTYPKVFSYSSSRGERGNNARRDLAPPSPLYSTPS